MTSIEVNGDEDVYWYLVDDVAQRSARRIINYYGQDDIGPDPSGLVNLVFKTVHSWWADKEIGRDSLQAIIHHADHQETKIDKHIEAMATGEPSADGTVEVNPRDVLERIALASFRLDVVEAVKDEYGDDVREAMNA